jgi:hypothetical protein
MVSIPICFARAYWAQKSGLAASYRSTVNFDGVVSSAQIVRRDLPLDQARADSFGHLR